MPGRTTRFFNALSMSDERSGVRERTERRLLLEQNLINIREVSKTFLIMQSCAHGARDDREEGDDNVGILVLLF